MKNLIVSATATIPAKSNCFLVPHGQHGQGTSEEQYFKMMVDFFIRKSCKYEY